jgi:hypothetical protein
VKYEKVVVLFDRDIQDSEDMPRTLKHLVDARFVVGRLESEEREKSREEYMADPRGFREKYQISSEQLKQMQDSIGTADVQNLDEDTDMVPSETTNNRYVGDIAGNTGNVNLGDIKINTSVNNENDEKKPAPETGRTTNITNTKKIGDITRAVHGEVTIGDYTYNINLKYSDIEDEVMKDLAESKLAPKTEADSDYHKLSDSKKEDIKNKMRDALDKEKAEYMKSMPAFNGKGLHFRTAKM